jgi:hypothetical protein
MLKRKKELYGQHGRKNLTVKMDERTFWSRWMAASKGVDIDIKLFLPSMMQAWWFRTAVTWL